MAAQLIVQAGQRALALASDPAVRAKVANYVQKATGSAQMPNLTQMVSKGPAPAAVVLRGAALAGINPDDMFAGISKQANNERLARLYVDLRQVYDTVQNKLDSTSQIRGDGDAEFAARMYRKKVIRFARERFGGPAAIREAHTLMRAFLEMDSKTLDQELAINLS